jgi:hypothetical protein
MRASTHSRPGFVWLRPLPVLMFGAIAISAMIISLYLAATSNYGGHHDTYLMLQTFLNVVLKGNYLPSRFTGYPVAEIGMGASAWVGGSSLSNTVNYGLFLASVLMFPFCFHAKVQPMRYLAFAALALSSTVLAFDNILSIDYPWSVFFWILGCLCLRRCPDRMFAVIPLALSIGARPVFAVFVLASILCLDSDDQSHQFSLVSRIRERGAMLLTTIFTGCLFYLPAWLKYGFGTSWISAVPPDNQGLKGLAARFIYKLALAFGTIQAILLLILLAYILYGIRSKRDRFSMLSRPDNRFLLTICAVNLLIFARMPVQLSYLQPVLYCFYYFMSQLRWRLFMISSTMIACVNMLNWWVQPRLLRVNHQSQELCGKTVGVGVSFGLEFDEGRVKEFKQQSRGAVCYAPWFARQDAAHNTAVIVKGQPLRRIR